MIAICAEPLQGTLMDQSRKASLGFICVSLILSLLSPACSENDSAGASDGDMDAETDASNTTEQESDGEAEQDEGCQPAL